MMKKLPPNLFTWGIHVFNFFQFWIGGKFVISLGAFLFGYNFGAVLSNGFIHLCIVIVCIVLREKGREKGEREGEREEERERKREGG